MVVICPRADDLRGLLAFLHGQSRTMVICLSCQLCTFGRTTTAKEAEEQGTIILRLRQLGLGKVYPAIEEDVWILWQLNKDSFIAIQPCTDNDNHRRIGEGQGRSQTDSSQSDFNW